MSQTAPEPSTKATDKSNEDTRLTRITEIKQRIDWMNENLSGCDWCCGGGDEEMESLIIELRELENQTPA